jgi:hypothetical protein
MLALVACWVCSVYLLCLIAMKIDAKYICCLLTLLLFTTVSKAQEKFEKAAFYDIMSAGKLSAVNSEIEVVSNSTTPNKEGYEGALLMRKAGLVTVPAVKLKYFKQGRIKFETALMNDQDNTEYHFLRLTIEEHAPKIVKYHSDIDADKLVIQKNYKDQSPVVQHAIREYCKTSKVLHAEEL